MRSAPRSSGGPMCNCLPARPFQFTSTGDRYGWSEGAGGTAHLTLFVQNGRIDDRPGALQMSALRQIAEIHDGEFRLTPNQNLIVANVATEKQKEIETIARQAGLTAPWSGLRRNSMACVALPTCGLALAESERYLPDLIDGARPKSGRARDFGRGHRHPHDGMSERLRAALPRRDRFGRKRSGPL